MSTYLRLLDFFMKLLLKILIRPKWAKTDFLLPFFHSGSTKTNLLLIFGRFCLIKSVIFLLQSENNHPIKIWREKATKLKNLVLVLPKLGFWCFRTNQKIQWKNVKDKKVILSTFFIVPANNQVYLWLTVKNHATSFRYTENSDLAGSNKNW